MRPGKLSTHAPGTRRGSPAAPAGPCRTGGSGAHTGVGRRSRRGFERRSSCLKNALKTSSRKPSTPALEPAPGHAQHLGSDGRVAPVQVRLLGQERVHVELAADVVPLPGRPAEERDPVVRLRAAGRLGRRRVAPEVPVAGRSARIAPRFLEPAMGRARVVHHEVEDDPDAAPVGLGHQPVEVVERAERADRWRRSRRRRSRRRSPVTDGSATARSRRRRATPASRR